MENFSGERANSTPDKFYFNEAKREISDILATDVLEDVEVASHFIDFDMMANVIERAESVPPHQTTEYLTSNYQLATQAWGYATHCFGEVQSRREFPDTDDFRPLIISVASALMRVDRILDLVKVRTIGNESSTHFVNSFSSHLANLMSNELIAANQEIIHPADADFAGDLAYKAFQKIGMERGWKSWLWAKTYTTAESMSSTLNLFNVLSDLPEVSSADTEMLGRHNEALAASSEELRTYTVKPAFSELEISDSKLLFVDQDVTDHRLIIGQANNPVTGIKLFHRANLSSSNASLERKRAHKNFGGSGIRVEVDGVEAGTPSTDIIIQPSGRVSIPAAHIAEFSQKAGLGGRGTLLESMILTQNFDLTVPTYIVDLVNEEAEATENQPGDVVADKLRRLLLARTRVLQTLGKDIADEIDKENSESNTTYKDIVKHGVVGHLRRLPEGYKPSPDAKRLCKEQLGVELPDGHTYVQIHTRGNIEAPSKGHKIQKNQAQLGKLGISA